jgi:hypothetical protein
MATLNPRLTVTLKPSTYAQLEALSVLTGTSRSAFIADILEQSGPVFSRLIQVLTAAEQAKQASRQSMVSDLQNAQARIENQLGLVLDGFDTVTKGLFEEAETVKRRSRKSSLTPLSNRGVRSPKVTTKVSKKGF